MSIKHADQIPRLMRMLELDAENWLYASDLAYGLGKTTAVTARILAGMAKRGEIKERRDERNRRMWSLRGVTPCNPEGQA